MNKKLVLPLMIMAVIVLIIGAAVGGFLGGKTYQKNQANNIRDSFMRERGIENFDPNSAPMQGGNSGQGAGLPSVNFAGGGMGRGTSGEVKSVDGNTILLTTGDTETTVTLSDSTNIIKYESGSASDIATGMQLMVMGDKDDNGNVTASQVTILNPEIITDTQGIVP